ncbi:TIM-barrel domain-containing protein [Caldivirga sp. UBA161]|uniref:glycoside hydrolase family 31 protein n=1 Tax=Caldivirga sp. UBA161 TaxID=1915569 RepID=UPI0025BD3DC3|nr:TIM-barrel domain-containing protein [Caldivirga sp. UBA161]
MGLTYSRIRGGVSLIINEHKLEVTFPDVKIARVLYTPVSGGRGKSLVVTVGSYVEPSVEEVNGALRLSTGELIIEVNPDYSISFINGKGELLAREIKREVGDNGLGGLWSNQVIIAKGKGFYGLGQHQGLFNYRNHEVYLLQRNPTETALPILVSNVGYGLMWDHYSLSKVSVSELTSDESRVEYWSEDVDAVDYYFILGPSMDDVVSGYRRLTGKAPMLPKWAFGYWQSRERYRTQEELISIVKEFRSRGIPIDVIVQDWLYWGKYGWNAMRFDEANYPNPAEMAKEVHELGARIVISIWPKFGRKTDAYRMFKDKGYLIPGSLNYDPFNDDARREYWRLIEENFAKVGIDGWWLDASEPELDKPRDSTSDTGTWTFYTGLHDSNTAMGRGSRFMNAYPLMHTKAVYEGQRGSMNRRVVILTRSAFLGQQRHSAITWSGDVHHDWGVLAGQIPAGLNFSISGIPYWTTDTGGFFSGDPSTPAYAEVFTRWLQWSTFCPIMRVHGTWYAKEPWMFTEPVYSIIKQYIEFRYRLLPYIYSVAWMVTSRDYTMMRPLVMDFQSDEEVLNVGDQYMFGPFIMVSPVAAPVRRRRVYLPGKVQWFDFWTGKAYTGGSYINAEAPLDRIPLHVKAGSILPLGPIKANSSEPENPIELRVYDGGDSEFTLYFDDGESYNYENGEYCLIPLRWLSGEGRLIIGDASGGYCGRINSLQFNVVLVSEGHGIGASPSKPDYSINYSGRAVEVKVK